MYQPIGSFVIAVGLYFCTSLLTEDTNIVALAEIPATNVG